MKNSAYEIYSYYVLPCVLKFLTDKRKKKNSMYYIILTVFRSICYLRETFWYKIVKKVCSSFYTRDFYITTVGCNRGLTKSARTVFMQSWGYFRNQLLHKFYGMHCNCPIINNVTSHPLVKVASDRFIHYKIAFSTLQLSALLL